MAIFRVVLASRFFSLCYHFVVLAIFLHVGYVPEGHEHAEIYRKGMQRSKNENSDKRADHGLFPDEDYK